MLLTLTASLRSFLLPHTSCIRSHQPCLFLALIAYRVGLSLQSSLSQPLIRCVLSCSLQRHHPQPLPGHAGQLRQNEAEGTKANLHPVDSSIQFLRSDPASQSECCHQIRSPYRSERASGVRRVQRLGQVLTCLGKDKLALFEFRLTRKEPALHYYSMLALPEKEPQ